MVRVIKNLFFVLLAAIVIATSVLVVPPAPVEAANTTYYVDSIAGNDSNNGTSESTPWKNLTKVNSVTFRPGDRINGSGAWGNPIIIDNYGTGNLPLISGAGAIYMQSIYITFSIGKSTILK